VAGSEKGWGSGGCSGPARSGIQTCFLEELEGGHFLKGPGGPGWVRRMLFARTGEEQSRRKGEGAIQHLARPAEESADDETRRELEAAAGNMGRTRERRPEAPEKSFVEEMGTLAG
jgi:hypothetical protein